MNYKILTIICILCFLFGSKVLAGQWNYIDPLRPTESFTIYTDPDHFEINDVLLDAKVCKKTDKYICITSEGFEFYVPRKIEDLNGSWKVNNFTFESHLNKRIQLFGINDDIYIIEKTPPKKLYFLYSKHRGLLGMGGYSKKSSRIFLLVEKCGFGAGDNCQ